MTRVIKDINWTKSVLEGGPLVVEDLDVTLQCVTYREPYIYRESSFYRLLRQLDYRGIQYTMAKRNRATPMMSESNVTLSIGDRSLDFSVV